MARADANWGNLFGGAWVFYEDIDLAGPGGAFDSMTLRYGAPLPKHRPYLVLEVLASPAGGCGR
ncbi:MAG: hypothetical protein HC909_02060, partial [Blastochloris sp.]|nr:hypothetical protein [Blastochloris sp.]